MFADLLYPRCLRAEETLFQCSLGLTERSFNQVFVSCLIIVSSSATHGKRRELGLIESFVEEAITYTKLKEFLSGIQR